jgi:hypothetical protein
MLAVALPCIELILLFAPSASWCVCVCVCVCVCMCLCAFGRVFMRVWMFL